MRLQQPNTLEEIELAGDEGSSEVPKQPATSDPWDYSGPNRDEVLGLLKPNVDRKLTVWLVAAALVVGFGLGWAGGFGWYGSSNVSALNSIIQTEAPSRRIAETKSGKTEGARKTASTLGLRTPPGLPPEHFGQASRSIAGSGSRTCGLLKHSLSGCPGSNRLGHVAGRYGAGTGDKADDY